MTEELPAQSIVRCDDCESLVELSKKPNNTLMIQCDCDNRSIKVMRALPEGW